MLAAADEGPASADAIAAINFDRAAGEDQAGGGRRIEVAIHLAGDVLIDEGAEIAAVDIDHRAPSDGTVGAGEFFDHAHLVGQTMSSGPPQARGWAMRKMPASFIA